MYFMSYLQLTKILLLTSFQVLFLCWDLALLCNNAHQISHLPLSSLAQWHSTLSLIRQKNHKSSGLKWPLWPFFFFFPECTKRRNLPFVCSQYMIFYTPVYSVCFKSRVTWGNATSVTGKTSTKLSTTLSNYL